MTKTALVGTLLLAVGCGGGAPEPQTPTNPPPAEPPTPATPAAITPSLPATAATGGEQLALGGKVFAEKCASCHGADGSGGGDDPPVTGPKALSLAPPPKAKLRKGEFKTAADVVKFVKKSMPMDDPGSLSEVDAYAVVAWELDKSGIKLDKKLDASTAESVTPRK